MKRKWVYTTGQAAEICKLSQQTIIRCFDSGQLEGFRVPGSRFRRIPRDKLVKFMKDNGIPMEGMDSDKIRVLVVDDDPEIVDILVEYLRQDGRFDVRTAQTGYDAGVVTQQFQPDAVILDYMLPDINGNVVCRTIRENPDLADIRILIISGVVNQADVDRLMEAGADDFIKKPFNIENVVDRLVRLVRD
ncbi:MAG TPA: response regulator [Phycisphaerae bacterium]|nr:response regulator [Phycisphaerae bacterium]HUT57486.1 response regulator [Phycisphaerae bacterium]